MFIRIAEENNQGQEAGLLTTEIEFPSIPARVITEIGLLSDIAKANGSLISLKDITTLTHVELSEEQLEAGWHGFPILSDRYELKNGFVLERRPSNGSAHFLALETEFENRVRASQNVQFGKRLASVLPVKGEPLIAISGSTSYHTTSHRDDLDLFCITKTDSLWVFLTKSMILARIFRLTRRGAPRICFSYAVDLVFAEKAFSSSNDALFARDALMAQVIHGTEFYKRLLKRNSWISVHFPRLYRRRIGNQEAAGTTELPASSSFLNRLVNYLLYFVVGNFITTKSAILNRKLLRQGRSSSIFSANLGPDHCIFESIRYRRLRLLYNEFNQKRSDPIYHTGSERVEP